MLSIAESLSICTTRGLSVTASGLVYAGKQGGFVQKANDMIHWEFEEDGLLQYILDATAKAPRGWIPIMDARTLVGGALCTIYKYIKNGKLKAVQYGRDHLYHVEKKELLLVFKNSSNEGNNNG